MAPTSVPLASALLSFVATIVALTMHAEAWRPTPLFAASDRPKFPFGGKRREPEPVDEDPGLLDEVAGGRYGGGQASLPTTRPATPNGSAAAPPPPQWPDTDDGHRVAGGSGAAGVSYDDEITWAPSAGGEATLSAAPPSMPGEPGWPSEMGLLEAIANMPEQSGWDQPPAGWSNGGGGAPAAPPLPLGNEPVPPFADLAPAQTWEMPAAPAPTSTAMPAWGSPTPLAPEPPHSAPTDPADDPDSWHSWQWQTAVSSEAGDPLPSPETVQPARPDDVHAAWEAAERGLDPTAYAMPAAPAAPDARPSIWAAPAAPVVDAWATPTAPVVDAWATPAAPAAVDAPSASWDITYGSEHQATSAPPPPPPPPPFADVASDASAGFIAPPPPPPPLSAPPSVAPLEATWDVAPRVEDPAPASWDASPAGAALEPLSALWDLRAPDLASPATGHHTPEPWFEPAGDPPTPGFSFSTTMLGRLDAPDASIADERFLAAAAPAEPIPATEAIDEWESLRGAFGGPDDAPSAATALQFVDDDDIDEQDLVDADTPDDHEWQVEARLEPGDELDTAPVAEATTADTAPLPAATPSVDDDPWWGIEPLDGHDPFALELPSPTLTDTAVADAPVEPVIETSREAGIETGTDDADTWYKDPFADDAELTSVSFPEIEDDPEDEPAALPSEPLTTAADGPWGDTLIDRLRLVVGPSIRAAELTSGPGLDDAAPTPPDSVAAPIVAESSFEARVARGLRMRLTEDEVVSFLGNAILHVAPEADVELLATNREGAFDRDAATRAGEHGGCDVARASRCPAIVGGETLTFADSTELDACPHLARRGGPACAAVCVPLPAGSGVVHLTTDQRAPLDAEAIRTIEVAAAQAAARLTELRAD